MRIEGFVKIVLYLNTEINPAGFQAYMQVGLNLKKPTFEI